MHGAQIVRNEAYLLVRRLGRLARAPWPTRVTARAGSQAFYEVVKPYNSSIVTFSLV
jgi:hypothetical protein